MLKVEIMIDIIIIMESINYCGDDGKCPVSKWIDFLCKWIFSFLGHGDNYCTATPETFFFLSFQDLKLFAADLFSVIAVFPWNVQLSVLWAFLRWNYLFENDFENCCFEFLPITFCLRFLEMIPSFRNNFLFYIRP